jgi:hypothetical protein
VAREFRRFASMIESMLLPYRSARALTVSPEETLWFSSAIADVAPKAVKAIAAVVPRAAIRAA